MSNIPSNTMPHAGGTNLSDDDGRKSTTTTGPRDTHSATYGAAETPHAQQTDTRFEATGDVSRQKTGKVTEKTRSNKTGLVVGLAVGAAAAAAIPFMLSKKKKSSERQDADLSADVYVDKRPGEVGGQGPGEVRAQSTAGGTTSVAGGLHATTTSDRKKTTNIS